MVGVRGALNLGRMESAEVGTERVSKTRLVETTMMAGFNFMLVRGTAGPHPSESAAEDVLPHIPHRLNGQSPNYPSPP